MPEPYLIRSMTRADTRALSDLINHTIRLGGSTAYENPFTPETFAEEFLGPDITSALVAETQTNDLAGFQCLFGGPPDPGIASFTDQRTRYPGAARALFPETEKSARQMGATHIRATIRTDNSFGLRYYLGLGFTETSRDTQFRLKNGTPIERVRTLYALPPL